MQADSEVDRSMKPPIRSMYVKPTQQSLLCILIYFGGNGFLAREGSNVRYNLHCILLDITQLSWAQELFLFMQEVAFLGSSKLKAIFNPTSYLQRKLMTNRGTSYLQHKLMANRSSLGRRVRTRSIAKSWKKKECSSCVLIKDLGYTLLFCYKNSRFFSL